MLLSVETYEDRAYPIAALRFRMEQAGSKDLIPYIGSKGNVLKC